MYRYLNHITQFVSSRQYLVGILSGYVLAAILIQPNTQDTVCSYPRRVVRDLERRDESIKLIRPLQHVNLTTSSASASVSQTTTPESATKSDRILCWVVTSPANKFKAEMVKDTWGRRCDKLLFVSSQNDSSLPAVGFPIGEESRAKLWDKAQYTIRYVYNNYLNDYDWFYKADDDTYAIMENMRSFLKSQNSSEPLFLGRRFRTFLSGGSGYILTRETLRRLVEKGLNYGICNSTLSGAADDAIVSHCLQKVGVIFGDTRDQWGHQRFIPYHVDEFYSNRGPNMDFIRNTDFYPFENGYNCCSKRAIAFHYISGYQMQMYEYLLYQLKIANETTPL